MENTNHVNRYFWLRITLIPFVSVVCLFKYLGCILEYRKLKKKKSDLSLNDRYERLIGFHEKLFFMKNVQCSFSFKKKLLQNQIIFIVDEDLNWDSLVLAKELSHRQNRAYPIFVLSSQLSSFFWNIIDSIFDFSNIQSAIKLGRSLILEKSYIISHPSFLLLLQKNLIPIVPIVVFASKTKKNYLIGKTIKPSSFIHLNSSALQAKIEDFFEKLNEDKKLISKKSKKSAKQIIKSLF